MKKRLSLALVVLLLFCVIPLFAAITDTFTGTNGDPLGGGWSAFVGAAWTIQSNKAAPTTNYASTAMIRTESFPNNQYAQVVTEYRTTGADPDAGGGLILRGSGTTYYRITVGSNTISLSKVIAGTPSSINDYTSGIADNTTFTLKAVVTGTTIEVFANGVSKGSDTDSAIASGGIGLFGSKSAGVIASIDDFECTAASAGPTTTSRVLGGGVF